MRIGTPIFSWDECPKCVLFDEEHGCRKVGEIEIIIDDEDGLVCLTGQMSEPDLELDLDLQEPWE